MATIQEQIEAIQAEIDKTQKNKATEHHIGRLKAKIAKLKMQREKAQAHAKASGGAKGFEVKKSGDATVALVGFPSVGKSTLISKVTDAKSETGNFAFTTLTCIPGVMEHRGAKIQILDLPGLIKGAAEGKGRGREILNVIRACDMVLYIVDPFQNAHFRVLHRELENAGMRLNEHQPSIFVNRTERGGIEVRSTVEQTMLEDHEIQDIVRDFGYTSAIVTLREEATGGRIVDALAKNRIYAKAVVAINKIDIATEADLKQSEESLPDGWPIMRISAFKDIGLEALKDFIYDNLGFMRIYLKPQGQEADLVEPLIVKDDSTVEQICNRLHRDFVRKFRFARVKGPSAKFDWQRGIGSPFEGRRPPHDPRQTMRSSSDHRPIRTQVEPSSSATRQSWLVPIEQPDNPVASTSARRRRIHGREASDSSTRGGIRERPCNLTPCDRRRSIASCSPCSGIPAF